MRPGTSLPSARLLAEQLGFTPCIVHRACQYLISSGHLVRKGYKLIVGAERMARPLLEGSVHLVSYWDGFNRAAARILTDRGVNHRTVELSFLNDRSPVPALRKTLRQKPGGVILWMPSWFAGLESVLDPCNVPMVICADGLPDLKHSSAGTDLRRGMEKALGHLASLGHRHIAHVSLFTKNPHDRELASSYRDACIKLGLKQSASAIWQMTETRDESVLRLTMLEQRKQHPEVTALVAASTAAALATKIFRVPDDLSVISFSDPEVKTRPPLTKVVLSGGDQCMATWACAEIISQMQNVESGRRMQPAHHALFVPDLIVCDSAKALAHRKQRTLVATRKNASDQAQASPWESWRKTYPFLKKSRLQNWRHLDLTKLANHSMAREHGWLGDRPLLHFSPGLRSIHGVPFQVINEYRNDNRAVVTFRSPHTHTAGKKELPAEVNLPVDGHAKALYFLHGCAHAAPVPFAEYLMHFKKGKAARVPLIPVGPSLPFALKQLGGLKPNLQDWWPDYEQQDFPHAMYATIFNPAEPLAYERTLYTLEWINPRPKEEISRIEIRVDPGAGPTLALIAVTALVAENQ